MGQGIKTIAFPVKDLAGAKALFQDLLYSVDEADYEEFLKRRAAVIDAIRADHPGLSKTTLIKLEDGTYTDTWRWDSPAQMGAAFGAVASVAEIGPAMSLTKDGTAANGEIIDEH